MEREKVLKGLAACRMDPDWAEDCRKLDCPYCGEGSCVALLANDAYRLLMEQEPRVMSAADVAACPNGTVLWVEERQGVTWNLFPLEIETSSIHPDTGTAYLFFITYHGLKRFECDEYNQVWRCWTSRPTDAQREVEPWESG